MLPQSSTIYDYIVRELAPTDHEPDEAPISIVCEPISSLDGSPARGRISIRFMAGTTSEEARAIANRLQAWAKGICHQEAPDGEAA